MTPIRRRGASRGAAMGVSIGLASMTARSNNERCAKALSLRKALRLGALLYRAFLSAALARSGAFDEPQNEQKDDGADEGIDDRGNEARADIDAEPRQQPAGDQAADDADDNIADQSESAAFDDHAGKPASDRADDQPDNDVHDSSPRPLLAGGLMPAPMPCQGNASLGAGVPAVSRAGPFSGTFAPTLLRPRIAFK